MGEHSQTRLDACTRAIIGSGPSASELFPCFPGKSRGNRAKFIARHPWEIYEEPRSKIRKTPGVGDRAECGPKANRASSRVSVGLSTSWIACGHSGCDRSRYTAAMNRRDSSTWACDEILANFETVGTLRGIGRRVKRLMRKLFHYSGI